MKSCGTPRPPRTLDARLSTLARAIEIVHEISTLIPANH